MPIQECTPRAVAELFNTLSPEDQVKALSQMAVTADHVWRVLNQLPVLEKKAFSAQFFMESGWRVFPIVINFAIKVFRQNPNLSDEDLHKSINESLKQTLSALEEERD